MGRDSATAVSYTHLDVYKRQRECYAEIRDFTYDILWNDLPKEIQEQLMDEEESI